MKLHLSFDQEDPSHFVVALSQGHQERRQQGTDHKLDCGALDLPYDTQDLLTPVLNCPMTRCYHTQEFTFEEKGEMCCTSSGLCPLSRTLFLLGYQDSS